MNEVANMAFDAMHSTIRRLKIAAYSPDVITEIARNACGTLKYYRASELIELGSSTTKTSFNQNGKQY